MWKLFGQTIFQSQKQHPQVWHSKNLNYINLLAFGGSINGWALVPCIKYKIQVTAYHGRRTNKKSSSKDLEDMIWLQQKNIGTGIFSLAWWYDIQDPQINFNSEFIEVI